MIPLEKEFEYFLKYQSSLVEKYGGKFIVIKGRKVIGAHNNMREAVSETEQKEEPGTFLVQKCESGKRAYTQTYHSRVRFSK